MLLPTILSLTCVTAMHAQAAPSVTPTISAPGTVPSLSTAPIAGEFSYSLTGSESYVTGYQGTSNSGSSTNISGQATYVSNSETHPLSLIYSGGYFFGNGGDLNSSSYQNVGVSQLLISRRWRLGIADTITFLPSSPLYGVSGVPFSGDIGTTPITTGGIPTQSILTNYGQQVSNTVSGSVSRDITGKTFVEGFGSYTVQRFLQTGLNNNSVGASASLGHHFSARDTVSGSYTYAKYSFSTPVSGFNNFAFSSNGVSASYSHAFNRKLSLQLSAGPQWISSNQPALIPDRVLFASAVSIGYQGERTRTTISYNRSPNIGSGVLLGALSDNINVTAQRNFSRNWTGGITANYGRASGLAAVPGENIQTKSFYGGVQATRRLGENFSAFGSYSAATQSSSGQAIARNAFDGTAHIVTVGLTFAPRSMRFGRP
ncbi:hypothetical protein Terro_2822 [Terriglobus roseus DSM 18391]|uniref:Uncharacterized protein n=1 Tax=Terriglobus roseus (strain DSM 18391 / NRRL B-41598 / KBS 63) TaxID=926566 RepID=I3ZIJ0_TERRK|nr:hypothetical protein [Terriglobus roseus]AFL89058.1 hypothetical protein Terro_2822 [Terriglobus roseus DSM 18391]